MEEPFDRYLAQCAIEGVLVLCAVVQEIGILRGAIRPGSLVHPAEMSSRSLPKSYK
jgi:hypothetical protein